MSTVLTVELAQPHPAQAQILVEAKRFNVLACGRRFGKDVLAMNLLAEAGLSGKPAAWFSPTYKMLSETFASVTRTLKPIATRINASEHRIELLTGGILDMWSLDSEDTARGRKYARVIVNEAAMVPGLMDAWNYVIRPTLADYRGDAWFLSTPKGRNGFWQLWQAGQDGKPDWASWQYPTSANPYIRQSEIDAMREGMPERAYQQEILAQFLENSGAVFRNVRAVCTITQPDEPEQHAGHNLVLGVDWGKQNDYTRLRLGCVECKRVVAWDGFNRIDYHYQRERLKLLTDKWKPRIILAERNSIGDPNIEELQRSGLPVKPFDTTSTSKPPLIENLALAIERGEWRFPIEDIDELEAYEMDVSKATGRPTYSAPEGGHDDRVIADALMVRGAQIPTRVLLFEA